MRVRELFDEFPLAGQQVVPLQLQQLLNEPLDVIQDWQRAERLLQKAIEAMPEQLEVKVALYKMYAYSNRFDESLALVHQVLETAALRIGINPDWRLVGPADAVWSGASGPLRLYLYSLKAHGFVCLRQGDVEQAVAVLDCLGRLDPDDQVGGSVVREMAERVLEPDL